MSVFEKYLTETEERQLLNTVKRVDDVLAKRDYHWMQLMRRTGIRVGALSQLTLGDAKDAIANKRLVLRDDISKKGHGYDVPLASGAVGNLKALIKLRRTQGGTNDDGEPLILSREHTALSVRSFQHRLHCWVAAAGLGLQVTPHWFRHTFAKRVIKHSTANSPVMVANKLLGHRNLKTTMIYAQPDREDLQHTMEEIG